MTGPRYEAGQWTAGFAARVTGVVDLDRLAGYAELPTAQRFERARAEDVAYLARLGAGEAVEAHEFRWDRRGLTISGAVRRADRGEAVEAAVVALREVLRAPDHVAVEECEPTSTPAGPGTELRRPCWFGRPTRPDAGVRYYLSVPPLWSAPQDWGPLLDSLGPAAVTVTLRRQWLGPGFAAMLDSVADQYERLATPGLLRTDGVYQRAIELPGEPFAAHAAPMFRDAAARYRGWVSRMRVEVSGAADRWAPDRVAAVLHAEPPGTPQQVIPPSFQLLRELADARDAAQAVWLPVAPLSGLPTVAPPPGRAAASAGVHYNNSTVHVEGDVFGGDKRA